MPTVHHVHILDCLTGRAFEQIVEARDQDEAAGVGSELEAEIAEAGADDVLNLGQVAGGAESHQRAVAVEVAVDGGDLIARGLRLQTDVERGEDAARDGQQVRVNWIWSAARWSCSSSSPVWRWRRRRRRRDCRPRT